MNNKNLNSKNEEKKTNNYATQAKEENNGK